MKTPLIRIFASLKITYILLILLIGEMVLFTGFIPYKHWNASVYFLFPLLLFLINLSSCTYLRIKDKKSWKNLSQSGPDLIHFGILIILVCGILNPFLKQEEQITVQTGDSIQLPEGKPLEIISLDFQTYDDGRPREWLVYLQVDGGQQILRINHPLRIGRIQMFLQSYQSLPRINAVVDTKELRLYPSQGMDINGTTWQLISMERKDGLWKMHLKSEEGTESFVEGEIFHGVWMNNITLQDSAVILLVIDPLTFLYYLAFILVGAGMTLTLAYRRLGRKKETLPCL